MRPPWYEVPEGGPRRARRRAFTLVELSVVLGVSLLAAAVVLPAFLGFLRGQQLRRAARRTLALAGEARGLAVARDTAVRLRYDPDAHALRLGAAATELGAGEEGVQALAPVAERETPAARLLEFPNEVEVAIESSGFRGDGSLLFYPDGQAEPATVRLEREGFPPIVLLLNPRTGRMRLRREGEE